MSSTSREERFLNSDGGIMVWKRHQGIREGAKTTVTEKQKIKEQVGFFRKISKSDKHLFTNIRNENWQYHYRLYIY